MVLFGEVDEDTQEEGDEKRVPNGEELTRRHEHGSFLRSIPQPGQRRGSRGPGGRSHNDAFVNEGRGVHSARI